MIHTMKPEAQPTREERIVLALDQAHKLVSDALTDLYQLRRETQMDFDDYELHRSDLRNIIEDLETVANRFDNQTESER